MKKESIGQQTIGAYTFSTEELTCGATNIAAQLTDHMRVTVHSIPL